LIKDKLENIKPKYLHIKVQGEKLNEQYRHYNKDLEIVDGKTQQYYQNQKTIEKNNDIKQKVKFSKTKLQEAENEISRINRKKEELHGDIKILEKNIDDIKISFDKIETLEEQIKAFEYYNKCVNRDGIPLYLMSRIIPIFESRTNEILSQLSEFSIELLLDDKNIDSYIVYNDKRRWSLEMTSGMERFVASMALRIALNNISNIPKPNFLFIDEGFGNLDSENLVNMTILFDYIKQEYEFVTIISHIDSMKDMVKQTIDIETDNKFSKITYL